MINRAAFVTLLALQVCLVWAYPRYATEDGPSHLYNAAVNAALHSGSWGIVGGFYRPNPRLVPNSTTFVILKRLMKIFSPSSAEKILVTTYLVLFALSFLWTVRTVCAGSEHFLNWGLVLGSNWFLSMGFYNFCFGLVLFQLSFGYWFKSRMRFGVWQWLVLFLSASLLYFSHLFCFLMTALLIGIVALIETLPEARRSRYARGPTNALIHSVVLPETCFLVLLLLNPFARVAQPQADPSQGSLLANILHGLSFSRLTHVFYLLLDCYGFLSKTAVLLIGVLFVSAFYWTLVRSRERLSALSYAFAAISVVCFALYIFCPQPFLGNGLLRERAGWFALWGAFGFLASRTWNAQGKLLVSVIASLVCALGLISGTIWRRDVSRLLRPYDDAARFVEPDKTMLSVCYCVPGSANPAVLRRLRIWPLEHAGDITALAARDISIANYEGMGSGFPIEYLPDVNPAIRAPAVMENANNPEVTDPLEYEKNTGKSIDYVLVWGGPDVAGTSGRSSTLSAQLQARYTLIYSAPAPSLLRLFRKNLSIP